MSELHYQPIKVVIRQFEDLPMMGAFLQDAICSISRMVYNDQQFCLIGNRFCWEVPPTYASEQPTYYRVHTQLIFDQVESVQHQGFQLSDPVRSLHFLTFWGEPGHIVLVFSNHCSIRLKTPQLQCWIQDIDEPWPTPSLPSHEEDEPDILSA